MSKRTREKTNESKRELAARRREKGGAKVKRRKGSSKPIYLLIREIANTATTTTPKNPIEAGRMRSLGIPATDPSPIGVGVE